MTCTECGMEIGPYDQYIAGVRMLIANPVPGWPGLHDFVMDLELFWACAHRPAEDAEVRLGSKYCAEQFCEKYPQYRETIEELYKALKTCERHMNN
jgi:hypothetical protein